MSEKIGKHTSILLNKMEQLIQVKEKKERGKNSITATSAENQDISLLTAPIRIITSKTLLTREKKILNCLTCGEPGHFSPNCPKNTSKKEYTKKEPTPKNTACFIVKMKVTG